MLIFDMLRHILVLILTLCLTLDYPLALNALITDTLRIEDPQELAAGYPWLDTDLSENLTISSVADPCEDFHLYAGKSLLLNKKYIDGYYVWNNYAEAATAIDDQAMGLMTDKDLKGHDAGLVQDMYDILIDWDTRGETGFKELKELTDPVLEAESLDALTGYLLTEDPMIFLVNFISCYVDASFNDSEHYAVFIDPEALLLEDSAEYGERTEYGEMTASYNEKMFLYYSDRLGMDKKKAKEMLESASELEEKLAKAIPSSEEMMRDDYVERANNEMSYEELKELTGNFPLTDIIDASGYKYDGIYIVSEPYYLKLLNEIYVEENLEAIRSLVYINALLDYGEYTDISASDYELSTRNECFGTDYWYTDEETAYDALSDILNEPLQKVYVEKYGSEDDKEKMEELCGSVIDSYREMLSENTWASKETIDYAIKKLDAIEVHAAYPDKWTDYSGLSLKGDTLLEAVKDITVFKHSLDEKKPGKEVDRECWADEVNILDCNAYYNPSDNAIYICLGMMQEPFFTDDMSTEEIYASVAGFWVGHEISHSFDANGARYDAEGNLRDWWSEEDKAEFNSRIEKLDAYLDTIVPFGDYHVTGKSIDTEMLADITGLQCALKMAEDEPDFDYDAFFKEFGSLNAAILYYSEELSILQQDTHPLNYLRTNVSVQQFEEFYETYGVEEGDTMYLAPEDRVAVW
ncbi:MAG: M13 family metallopeptidase [Lachnospiraceae bacterium]|nr:M13 family metallopeptidase [Lachnospiraceae bacterium]